MDFKNGGFQTFDYKCTSTFYSHRPLFFSVSQQNAIVLKSAELSTMNASTPSLISQCINACSLGVLATQPGIVTLNKYTFISACRVQTAHQNGALKDAGLFPWCRGWSPKLPSQLLLMLWPMPQPIRMPPFQCQLKLETKKVRQHQLVCDICVFSVIYVFQRITLIFFSCSCCLLFIHKHHMHFHQRFSSRCHCCRSYCEIPTTTQPFIQRGGVAQWKHCLCKEWVWLKSRYKCHILVLGQETGSCGSCISVKMNWSKRKTPFHSFKRPITVPFP